MEANPVRRTFEDMAEKDKRGILRVLEDLRSMCVAAQAGYEAAANEVQHDYRLRDVLLSFAQERRAFSEQLRDLLIRFHRVPDGTWMAKAELHRVWIDLRAYLEHHDPVALLSECERGERFALDKYEKALKVPLSLDVEEVLIDQAASIRAAREALDKMRRPW
jgi:uncharacterized protein (TIGR02284 family)